MARIMRKRLGLIVCAGICMSAVAAPPSDGGAPSDVLKGPSADPRTPPTSPGVFGDPSESRPGRPAANSRARYDLFQKSLAALMHDDAPAGLRLSPEQSERVRAIQHEFRQANEAFFREHQEEIRKIRRQTGDQEQGRPRERPGAQPSDGGDRKPANGAEPVRKENPSAPSRKSDLSADERDELMRRLRALEEQRPDPGPFQARAWDILREDQRAHLTAHMEREAEAIAKRRGEERLKKEQEERAKSPAKKQGGPGAPESTERAKPEAGGAGAKPGTEGRGGAGAPNAERLAERLQISSEQARSIVATLSAPPGAGERGLSPDDRTARRIDTLPESVLPVSKRGALKQMLANRAKEGGGQRQAPKQPAKRDRKGDETPPPSVNDVNVPKP